MKPAGSPPRVREQCKRVKEAGLWDPGEIKEAKGKTAGKMFLKVYKDT